MVCRPCKPVTAKAVPTANKIYNILNLMNKKFNLGVGKAFFTAVANLTMRGGDVAKWTSDSFNFRTVCSICFCGDSRCRPRQFSLGHLRHMAGPPVGMTLAERWLINR
jgi:hypothetical protein